jgi:plastocyanin
MNGKTIALVLVVIALVAGGGYYLSQGDTAGEPQVSSSPEVSPTPTPTPTSAAPTPAGSASPSPAATSGAQVSVKTFAVSGNSFSYDPKQIVVKKGDTVRIVFTNTEGFHDWVIDEFNARTPKIPAGQVSTIEFVADKAGSFEYYCSVGSHRAQGMVGTLVVQ